MDIYNVTTTPPSSKVTFNVTLMLNVTSVLLNATTPRPRKSGPGLKCIPQQLVSRFTEEQLKTIEKRTGLKPCKKNEKAIETTDRISSYPGYHVCVDIIRYKYYVLLPVAVLCNGLLIASVGRRFYKVSVYCNMGMLAVWDTLTIFLRSLQNFLLRAMPIGLAGCRFFDFIGGMSGIVANWILVLMTIERSLAVLMPLKYSVYDRVKWAVVGNVVIVIVAAGIKVRTVALTQHEFYNNRSLCQASDDIVMNNAFLWLDAIFYSLLPLILIFVFNILIIIGLAMANVTRRKLKNDQRLHQEQVTIMLLMVSIVFTVLTAPLVIFFIIGMDTDKKSLSTKEFVDVFIARTVTQLLSDINHCINFFLYVLSSRGFRADFYNMLCCCRQKSRPKVPGVTSEASSNKETLTSRTQLTKI